MMQNAGEIKKQVHLVFGMVICILFFGVFFWWLDPTIVSAADSGSAVNATESSSGWGIGYALETAFRALIFGAFTLFGWFAGIAASLFATMIDPRLFAILNSTGIYQMWQFIRDFFNLFFILALLYIAFTTIFQVAKDYKKALLNLVIMALLVNFSFPISRFLIDVGNVPMYYFANQISDRGPAQGLGSVFGASDLEGILIHGDKNKGVTSDDIQNRQLGIAHLLSATVFLFIFSITLMVLAVMFVIRLTVLVILVIFSSVGFAGTVIPGMGKFASQWWESFSQYVLYGPAAMLMVLVSVRFFSVLSDRTGPLNTVAMESATNMSANGMQDFMSAAIKFSIPIVMLWIAIGLSSKMSIAGSAAVVGTGLGAIAWTRKKVTGGAIGGAKWVGRHNPISSAAVGAGQGLAQHFNDNKMVKWFKAPSKLEAKARGAVGPSTVEKEMAKRHQKMVADQVAEDKKNNVDVDTHANTLVKSTDPVEREAAALALVSEKELRTTEQLTKALQVFSASGNKNAMVRAIENAKEGAVAGLDKNSYKQMVEAAASHPDAIKTLDSKMKKEGNIHVKIEHEVAQAGGDAAKIESVYEENLKMSAEDFAKQGGVHSAIGQNADLTKYMKKRVDEDKEFYQEALKKIKTGEGREKMRTLVSGSGQDQAIHEKMKQAKSSNQR